MTHTTDQERAEFEAWYASRYGARDFTKALEFARRADAYEVWQASRRAQVVPKGYEHGMQSGNRVILDFDTQANADAWFEQFCDSYDAAAPQPQEVAQLDDTNVADMVQAVDSTEPTPVQMPEPVAVAFRSETEEYGSTATSFYPSDRIGMGWTALYTEHQVRQLLAQHGIK